MVKDDTPELQALMFLSSLAHRVQYDEHNQSVQVILIQTQEPVDIAEDIRQCLMDAHRRRSFI